MAWRRCVAAKPAKQKLRCCAAERLRVAVETLAGGRDREEVAQERNASMSVRDEMLDRRDRSADVVGGDAVRVEMGGRPVDEHERGARSLLLVEIGVIVARGDDD